MNRSVPRARVHAGNSSAELGSDSAGEDVGRHVGFVVDQLLCTGCATCDAACEVDAISMAYSSRSGVYEPKIDVSSCTLCGLCVAVCPGFRLDLSRWPLTKQATEDHRLVGPYAGIWRVHSADEALRENGASGGAVTEIVRYLFRTGRINGAIVTRMVRDAPLEAQAILVNTEQELRATQKSKYCPHPHNSILKALVRDDASMRRLAFVGLPSHVHGLRNLQRKFPHLQTVVPYVLSLFTAHVPARRATEFLLYTKGVRAGDVECIDYRGGGVPGRLCIRLRNGSHVFVPHLHWSYWGHAFGNFFYPPREWLYSDKLSRWADWSIGDNWQQSLTDRKGASTVVSRTPEAEQLLLEMQRAEALIATPMTAEDLAQDQDLENKLNIGIRLKVWRWLGGRVPDYKPPLPVRWRDAPRTLRFAVYVWVGTYRWPMWLLRPLLGSDYLVRKRAVAMVRGLARRAALVANAGWAVVKALRVTRARPLEPLRARKILMIGGYGWKDIGDEAMPHADLLKLKQALPADTRYVMASPDRDNTAVRHGEGSIRDLQQLVRIRSGSLNSVRWGMIAVLFLLGTALQKVGWRMALWPEARGFLDELSTCDIVFNVGGGNLNSFTRGELYKKSVTYIAAAWLGVPVLVSGQTIGPFSRRSDRLLARLALGRVRLITFRDKAESQATVDALGVSGPVMIDAADDAITLPAVSHEEAVALLKAETGIDADMGRPGLVAFLNCKASLSIFRKAGQTNQLLAEKEVLRNMADRLLARGDVVVVFVATDFTPGVDDRVVHHEVYRKLRDKSHAFVLENEYSDRQLKGLIALADVALGMRYHFHVFAAAEGVPFLGFASGEYQMRKLRGLANLLNEPGCYFDHDIEHAHFEDLWWAVEDLLERRRELARRLLISMPTLLEASHLAVEEARAIVGACEERA